MGLRKGGEGDEGGKGGEGWATVHITKDSDAFVVFRRWKAGEEAPVLEGGGQERHRFIGWGRGKKGDLVFIVWGREEVTLLKRKRKGRGVKPYKGGTGRRW